MTPLSFRKTLAWAVVLVGACGGKELANRPAPVGPDGGTYTEADGATCVDIDLSAYDTFCDQPSDCIEVLGAKVCDGYCGGCQNGTAIISAAEKARYQSAISALVPGTCDGCPQAGSPQCTKHTCTICSFGDPACAEVSDADVSSQ
jgi:hypothetical protein